MFLRALLIVPAMAAALAALPLHADSLCGNPMPTTVTVTTTFEPIAYDFKQSMMMIKKLASDGTPAQKSAQHEQWPVGLSSGEMSVKMNSQIQTRREQYGTAVCGTLKSLEIELSFIDNAIFVAREFPKRSCPFKEVLAHEESHKATDRVLLAEYAQKAQDYFTKATASMGVVVQPGSGEIETEFNRRISDYMTKFTEEMTAERAKRQAAIDSPEEYARITAACDGQVNEIVTQRLQLLEDSRGTGVDTSALNNR